MRISRWETLEDFHCPSCGVQIATYVDDEVKKDLHLDHCLLCNGKNLFKQKLFNRNWGVGIVVAGIIVSFFVSLPIIPLLVVGLIDLLLYLFLPFMVVCYNCDSEFRGYKMDPGLELFDHLKAAKAKKQPTYPGAEESH